MQKTACYEQPLNERIRLLLRLEFLFQQITQTAAGHSSWDSRMALQGLCEILNLTGRNELKSELLKELDRHATFLNRLRTTPGVDSGMLDHILGEIEQAAGHIHNQHSLALEETRQNDFLSAFCQRNGMASSTCPFDLPILHHWLQQDSALRARHIEGWLKPFGPMQGAVELILKLVRDSAVAREETAVKGFFQRVLDSSAPNQMVRVVLPKEGGVFPEISGGKQRFSIRFMEQPDPHKRAAQTALDIPFRLVCCII